MYSNSCALACLAVIVLLTPVVISATAVETPLAGLAADQIAALERLQLITDMLEEEGQVLDAGPLTGTVQVGDTLMYGLDLNTQSSHHIFVITDSMYHRFRFWIEAPDGSTRFERTGDMASFAVFPDTEGDWVLGILLLEPDEFEPGDSASFALAVARYPRQTIPGS
jgi:hypothetical protein